VVRHYSELDEDRLHADGERILKPLKLGEDEIDDLVAFLESLSPSDALPVPVPVAPKLRGCDMRSNSERTNIPPALPRAVAWMR
jgi:hypothetical protein